MPACLVAGAGGAWEGKKTTFAASSDDDEEAATAPAPPPAQDQAVSKEGRKQARKEARLLAKKQDEGAAATAPAPPPAQDRACKEARLLARQQDEGVGDGVDGVCEEGAGHEEHEGMSTVCRKEEGSGGGARVGTNSQQVVVAAKPKSKALLRAAKAMLKEVRS